MKNILLTILFPILLFFGCDKIENPVISEGEGIVIQGYLYANKPVNDIKISTLASFDESSWQQPINNAEVFLYKNNNPYPLSLTPGDSGYYHYTGDDLSINAGDSISISVTHNGTTATGSTWVPYKPSITYLSKDTLFFSQPSRYYENPESMFSVKWTSPDSENVYYTVNMIPQFGTNWPLLTTNSGTRQSFEKHWTKSEFNFNHYYWTYQNEGKYIFIVYRVNMEYINLISYLFQVEEKFIGTSSNINNGYGVFTAFNSDSCEIYLFNSNE